MFVPKHSNTFFLGLNRILESSSYRVEVDDREHLRPGFKYNEWELKGVPLRLELGPRDLAKDQFFRARRDEKGKAPIPRTGLVDAVRDNLEEIQSSMFERLFERALLRIDKVDSLFT